MANHKSAQKRIRQNAHRRLRNRFKLSTTRTAIKKLRNESDASKAAEMFPGVASLIDKCVKHNIYHKNKAANLKGKLQRHVNGL
ncbi:MAG: 30S ribosomal protein S20 [Bacteroidia bacterium]|nr:30S ribosomal protein S20 [Bacteroidia bacterium]